MGDAMTPSKGPLPPPWDRIFGLGTRIFVWGLIAGTIYVLRPFFLLVFLTFLFAYVQTHGVERLQPVIARRWLRAVLVFAVLLGALTTLVMMVEPRLRNQFVTIGENYDKWIRDANDQILSFVETQGLKDRLPEDFDLGEMVQELLGLGDPAEGQEALQTTLTFMTNAATFILAIGSAFFLSLLFSFLIVLDLPKLSRGVKGLAKTKIGFIYSEVAENIYGFCQVLGQAMEAQLFIAICNTVLTAVGLWSIGLGEGNMVFLSMIVFVCSFIPVAGVFISSTPICIAALTEGGFGLLLAAIGLIMIIHFIEAYLLNPRIYGSRLRMNPVLTLIILTLCGKLFGPWGLILGIPVFNYVFSHAIRYEEPQLLEERDEEREAVSAAS